MSRVSLRCLVALAYTAGIHNFATGHVRCYSPFCRRCEEAWKRHYTQPTPLLLAEETMDAVTWTNIQLFSINKHLMANKQQHCKVKVCAYYSIMIQPTQRKNHQWSKHGFRGLYISFRLKILVRKTAKLTSLISIAFQIPFQNSKNRLVISSQLCRNNLFKSLVNYMSNDWQH